MEKQITVVIGRDGRILNATQSGVFTGSNEVNELVVLTDYAPTYILRVNFYRQDGVRPKTRYMAYMGEQVYEGKSYHAYRYDLTAYQLARVGALMVSVQIRYGEEAVATGNFTIDVESSIAVVPETEPIDENEIERQITNLTGTVNAITQPPDYSRANEVSTEANPARVTIGAAGNLVFENLRGKDGTDQRYTGEWTAGTVYRNDEERVDSATFDGSTYVAVATHTADESNKPPNAAYWSLSAAKGRVGDKGDDSMWITGFTVSETDGHLYGLSTRELDSLPYRIDPYTGHLLMGIQRKENNA